MGQREEVGLNGWDFFKMKMKDSLDVQDRLGYLTKFEEFRWID